MRFFFLHFFHSSPDHFSSTSCNNNHLQQSTIPSPKLSQATMEEVTINSLKDLFGNDLEAFCKKLEELVARPSTSTSEWPLLLTFQVNKESLFQISSIPPGHRTTAGPSTPVSWSIKKRSWEVFSRLQWNGDTSHSKTGDWSRTKDSVLHYNRFKDQNVGWNKTGNLRRALKIHRHPMSVLLPMKFRYLGCPAAPGGAGRKAGWDQCLHKTLPVFAWIQRYQANENDHVYRPGATEWGCLRCLHERIWQSRRGAFVLNICLKREDFQAIQHILMYWDQQMMVVFEGRRPLCWSC